MREGQSRRSFLEAAAAGAVSAGYAVSAREDDAITEPEIELVGRTGGWDGRSPESIADEDNPTLELVAGRDYAVVWENEDGGQHDFVVEDEAGEELASTDVVTAHGATATVEFTAREGMAEYYCTFHPGTMRGEIEIVDADGGTGVGDGGDQNEDDDAADGDEFPPEGPAIGLETVADGLTAPTAFAVADEERDRRFVADQTGQIRVHGEDGLENEPFLDLEDRLVDLDEDFDERGLLGLAFHPEFEANGRFFVRYSAPPREGTPAEYDHTFVLSEFETGDDRETADPDSERAILEIPQPQANHNAGPIAFGPDGYLYVATGDGGGAGDAGPGHADDWYDENEGGNGQDTTETLLGGVLRIDVDGETSEASRDRGDANGDGDERSYAIPEDNPFAEDGAFDSDEGRPEYYAWGLRNPWGMSFDDGELIAADVGQARFEEINVLERGGNYGWNVREGTYCFSPASPEEPPENCPDETPADVRGGEPLLNPVVEYPREYEGEPVGSAVVAGFVYRGDAVPDLRGEYVFGDWSRPGGDPGGSLFFAEPPEGFLEDDAEAEDDDGEQNEDAGDAGADADDDTGDADEEAADTRERWPMRKLAVEAEDDLARDGDLARYVLRLGRGADGELYVLTTGESGPRGDTGAVHRIVDPDDGDESGTGEPGNGDDESGTDAGTDE